MPNYAKLTISGKRAGCYTKTERWNVKEGNMKAERWQVFAIP